MITANDTLLLRRAMTLAQRGEGAVNPNPLVGAVIVRDGEVIAEGWHERYGDLHAERNAFRHADEAGIDCEGATMYVTLEPCCHQGHQPPCTEAIIEHRIKRVVVGLTDPNPLVAGKGLQILRNAGIQTEVTDDEQLLRELRHQNRVFLKFITTRRPWVLAKWAMTLDGKICTRTGDSRWVSGEESRAYVHSTLRSRLMAIMVGIGTVLADDPMLTVAPTPCPSPRMGSGVDSFTVRQPIRIVVDRKLRIPLDSKLVRTASEVPVIVAYAAPADKENAGVMNGKRRQLEERGVRTWKCDTLEALMERCGEEKIDGILLEGGGILNEAMMQAHLIDEVMAFIAPKLTGGSNAKTPVEGRGVALMADSLQLTDISVSMMGNDVVVSGRTE